MKIGDYVRTESGYIDKIEGFSGDAVWFENDTILVHKSRMEECGDKTSPNLIDLIEVGDYLNGCRVLSIEKIHEKPNGWVDIEDWGVGSVFHDEIKEILTKEQYEREVFRV